MGPQACSRLAEKELYQSQLAIATSLLACLACLATIVFSHQFLPNDLLVVIIISLLMFASVIPIYRTIVPCWTPAAELAKNLIPGSLCLACGYCAITLGGQLPLSSIYASAIPLLSVMICRRPYALFWTLFTVCLLLVGLFTKTDAPTFPSYINLLAGVTVVVPTLISMLLHRKVWEAALENEALALRKLRDQHEEQRQFDRKLRDFERQESLGLMAGRIAHDFNNLLTAIMSGTELLRIAIRSKEMDALASYADIIQHAAENASELSMQLLDYTGKSRVTIVPIDIAKRIRNSIPLAQAACPPGTKITIESEEQLWVEGDPTQIDQVIVNLVRNAAQSYEPDTGVVSVVLNSVEIMPETRCHCTGKFMAPGRYVQLQIKDQGRGISASRLSHIFEPFYTDREEGTGLGLAAVSGIVTSHGGGLIVATQVAVGTTFSLLLPKAPAPLVHPKDATSQVKPYRTNKKLLVADDEELVLNTVSRLVRSLGYDVVCVVDGLQAVGALESDSDICGVIMDVSMPVMDGYQALQEIRNRNAQMPVLLMSGYSGPFPAESRNDQFTEILTKPFSLDRLKEKLSAMLC